MARKVSKVDQQEETPLTEDMQRLIKSLLGNAREHSRRALNFCSNKGRGQIYSVSIENLTEAGVMKLAAQQLGEGALPAP